MRASIWQAPLAGPTDADAIALSMANLADQKTDMPGVAARTILIAIMANSLTKTSLAAWVVAPELRNKILPLSALLFWLEWVRRSRSADRLATSA